MGQGKDAKPGGFRCAESTREEEPTSWARAAVELQVLVPQAAPRAHLSCPQVSLPCLQDEATSAFSPASPLGPGVLLPAPLAVGTVHSLPQVCAWGCDCPLHVWLCTCVYTGPGPGPSSAHWTNGTLAPRKRAQRQQTGLQGSLIPVEMVSARLSLGSGQRHQGINQTSLPLVTTETGPRPLPQQV